MTIREQKIYWLRFHRFQQRYEKIYIPKINAVLKAQVQQYIEKKDTFYIRSSEMNILLMQLHQTVGAAWAYHNKTIKRGGLGFSERMFQLIRQYYFAELLNISEEITQTTIKLIQEVLTDAAQNGWGINTVVDKITAPDFTRERARLIARTETVAAANQAVMINAREMNRPSNKIWIATYDDRTRPDHAAVNRKVIPLNDKFTVGDTQMDCPGDKNGGAKEVCNCRCTVAIIPI